MTQALTNYDILNTAKLPTDSSVGTGNTDLSSKYTTDTKSSYNFNEILDKTVQKENSAPIDADNVNPNGDMSDTIENFKEFLTETTREVNMEKSLDLTLARDITEIIGQLQSALSTGFSNVLNTESCENIETIIDEVQPNLTTDEETVIGKIVKSADDISDDIDFALDNDVLDELNIESISAETDFSGNESMTQQESTEEFSVKIMLNQNTEKFDINSIKSAGNNPVKPTEISSEKIVEQITKHLDSLKSTSKVNIVLNPESLGRVNLQIINSKGGLTAQFTVTTNDARELLMKGLDGLKESLLTQGISVDNLSIKVSESEEAYNPDWTEKEGSENGTKQNSKQNREEKEKGQFEKTITESLKKNNGKV